MEPLEQVFESASSIARRGERLSAFTPPARFTSDVRYTVITGDVRTSPRCLLSVTHPLKLRWDWFIMLLAVWNCFYVPYSVAFLPDTDNIALIATSIFVDIAYFADVGIYLRTSYLDLITGEEVTHWYSILTNYFSSGKLAVDVISAIPFDIIYLFYTQHEGLQLITLTKVIRLLRLSKILVFMRATSYTKLTIKLLQLLFIFVVYLHITACLWFMLIDTSQVFIPPALYIDGHSEEQSLFHHRDPLRQYAYSLYMAVYMLTAAELGPRSSLERIFCGCAVLLGQLFQGYMFGEIAVVLFNLNKKNALIAEVQNASADIMLNMKLKNRLQAKISLFMRYSHGLARKQTEFEEFFSYISPSLKQEVRSFIFAHVMLLNPALTGHEQIQQSVLRHLDTLYCQPEEKIILQGEEATTLYFVGFGMCDVHVLDEHKITKKMKSLGMGQHFGEIALLYPTPRTATVTAASHVTLAMLTKQHFAYLSRKYPKFRTIFKVTAVHYHDDWKRFIKSTLRKCAYFRNLKGSVLSQIIYRLPTRRLAPFTHIVREGDVSDTVTFVLDGMVEVYIPINDERLMTKSTNYLTGGSPVVSPFTAQLKGKRHTLAQIKKRKDMRYLMKMSLENLTMGSILTPNLVLFENEKASFYAQTTETTIIMTLSRSLLLHLCEEFVEVNNNVAEITAELMSYSRLRRLELAGLDYIRSFLTPLVSKKASLWSAEMKVKHCAIGKLLEKRQIRANGFQDVASLSHKLKGLILAEKQGDFEMAEKIRRGYLPIAADRILPALALLRLPEVENPVLTQFAIEAVKVAEVVTERRDAAIHLYYARKGLERERERTKDRMKELVEMVKMLVEVGKVNSKFAG